MVAQFVGLERRAARSGKDTVDHAPGAHDDVANSVAGVVSLLSDRAEPGMVGFYRERFYEMNVELTHRRDRAVSDLVALRGRPFACAQGWTGRSYTAGADGLMHVAPDDAGPLRRAGFVDAEKELIA